MRTMQELSDRADIDELLTDYCYAIDTHDWEALDDLFTADAWIDFTATGGQAGDLVTIKEFLGQALNLFAGHQHLVATSKIVFDGDTAIGRTICHNPMAMNGDPGQQAVLMVGLWYHDTFVRTADGWRISGRKQELCYLKHFA